MVDRFEEVRDPVLGESVLLAKTSTGLPVRVSPTDRFNEVAAVITFAYGSTDLGFEIDGAAHESPEGVAHYLEHKLFEDEDLQAFDRFSRRGARVNAMTGFAQTTYYFTATDQIEENLKDLLHLVSNAHITPENVEKERGIIAQEIRMYEDSPDYRGFFDFLGSLYQSHPVRHPVGGTVASIGEITAEELLACFEAFYCTGNAALAVSGPVDPGMVLDLAENCGLRQGEAPRRLSPADLGPAQGGVHRRQIEVSRARAMVGFKDRSIPATVEDRLQRNLRTSILLDSLFGASSEQREALRIQGLVDDSLSASYMSEPSFGVTAVGCETDDPDACIEVLAGLMRDDQRAPVAEDDLERMRRRSLGSFVRSFESVRNLAFRHAREGLDGTAPFSGLARMQAVTLEQLEERRREHFVDDAFAAAVIEPQTA